MLFIHLSADENLGCFHFLATMNNDAMTIHVEVLVWKYIFSSLGYIPRSEIVDYMVTLLNVQGNCQSVFHNNYIILHFYQQCLRVPCPPHSQHLFFSLYFIIVT